MAVDYILSDEDASEEEFDSEKDRLEGLPDLYVRIRGYTPSSPCSICAPYIGMVHDGTGNEVPLPYLHDNCVCQDIPLSVLGGGLNLEEGFAPIGVKPKEKFEWMAEQSDATIKRLLGKQRFFWFSKNQLDFQDFYSGRGQLEGPNTISDLIAKSRNKKELVDSLIISSSQARIPKKELEKLKDVIQKKTKEKEILLAWKPVMLPEDAKEFTKDSKIKGIFKKPVEQSTVVNIASRGFREEGRQFGGVWGDGVYLPTTDKMAQNASKGLSSPVFLSVRVNVKNPAYYEIIKGKSATLKPLVKKIGGEKIFSRLLKEHESLTQKKRGAEKKLRVGIKEGLATKNALKNRDEALLILSEQEWRDYNRPLSSSQSYALTQTLIKLGFDALLIKSALDDDFLNFLIVLSARNVVVEDESQ